MIKSYRYHIRYKFIPPMVKKCYVDKDKIISKCTYEDYINYFTRLEITKKK